jgi:hypothetical protein
MDTNLKSGRALLFVGDGWVTSSFSLTRRAVSKVALVASTLTGEEDMLDRLKERLLGRLGALNVVSAVA